MYLVTVRDAQKYLIAQNEAQIDDPDDDRDIRAAARSVCAARGRKLPAAGTVKVEKRKGRNWQPLRTMAI